MFSLFRCLLPSFIHAMKPLITVVGATGTGKSKLAVDLAARFNGEIINGDAMQMYRGLPIITNQMPLEERNGIPHHLIDHIGLEEEPWRIGMFRKESIRLIDSIHTRGKLPILVGGTHYYTQSVLFNETLVGSEEEENNLHIMEETDPSVDSAERWPILDAPAEVMLEKLKEVDPVMAERWHPKDIRKIRRSLEIYFQTGRPASQIYVEQRQQKQEAAKSGYNRDDSTSQMGQIRYPTLLFWTHTKKEVLNERLNARVDSMIGQGLLVEAQRMSDLVNNKRSHGVDVDKTRGVWIAIGYKELEPYFEALQSGTQSGQDLETLKKGCVEDVKTSTRQYATRQLKWIRNKLYRALAEVNSSQGLFVLDTTDVGDWETAVKAPSEEITRAFLRGGHRPDPKTLSLLAKEILNATERDYHKSTSATLENFPPKQMTCEPCNKTMFGQEQWEVHIKSRTHKRARASLVKRTQSQQYLRQQEISSASLALSSVVE